MTGLGDTTAMLRRLRRQQAETPSGAARMREQPDFGPNPGQLRMWLHAPAGLAADAPLIVVLHGCGQGAEAYATQSGWIALADRLGFAVLAPEQTSANNPNRCFNWFLPGDIQRGQGEAASIAQMVAFVGLTTGQGRGGAFVTGLSAGGAMTSVMLAAYPDLFLGGAVIAGLPYGVAQGVPDAMRAMSRPDPRADGDLADLVRRAGPATKLLPSLSIWHGEADMVVNVANAGDLARQRAALEGLRRQPDAIVTTGRTTRSVWRNAGGEARVELNLVRGLGHGVPLSTTGEGAVGSAAPFMLEAGISSSHEIARFWGLEDPAASRPIPAAAVETHRAPAPEPPAGAAGGVAGQVLESLKTRIPAEVEAVIAKAFRAAGLMP